MKLWIYWIWRLLNFIGEFRQMFTITTFKTTLILEIWNRETLLTSDTWLCLYHMDTNSVTSVALIMSRVFWFYPSYEQTIIGQNANVLKVSRQQLCTIHLPRDHRCWLSCGRAIPDESRTCINFSVRRCEYKLCKEVRIIHKLDVVSASGWLKQIFRQPEALPRSG